MARLLMVIAPERFRDEELFETRAVLEDAGHTIVIASTRTGPRPGSRGGTATADILLADVRTGDYSGVIFVGGGGSKLLFDNKEALAIARGMNHARKVVGAICLAPVILANAGVLRGRKATVAGTEAKTIVSQGATYTGPGVTVDGNIVTANGPKSSMAFGQAVQSLLDG
jgi:protease I